MLVFPLGMRYDSPNDANDRRVARIMMRPGAARDRLTEGIYIGTENDPVGRVEHALTMAVAVESVMRRVQRAVRSDADEAARLRAADAARYDAIMVDEFPPQAFERSGADDATPDTTRGRISA